MQPLFFFFFDAMVSSAALLKRIHNCIGLQDSGLSEKALSRDACKSLNTNAIMISY